MTVHNLCLALTDLIEKNHLKTASLHNSPNSCWITNKYRYLENRYGHSCSYLLYSWSPQGAIDWIIVLCILHNIIKYYSDSVSGKCLLRLKTPVFWLLNERNGSKFKFSYLWVSWGYGMLSDFIISILLAIVIC